MNIKQFRKQAYIRPAIKIIATIQQEHLLSISGQHKDAESGGSTGDAKKAWFDFDEEEEENISTSSKGQENNWRTENY